LLAQLRPLSLALLLRIVLGRMRARKDGIRWSACCNQEGGNRRPHESSRVAIRHSVRFLGTRRPASPGFRQRHGGWIGGDCTPARRSAPSPKPEFSAAQGSFPAGIIQRAEEVQPIGRCGRKTITDTFANASKTGS
jgi:hypothetical protein